MILYQIVKALQEAQGSNAKQAILMKHKDNQLLKTYMKAVYDPAISYYQTKVPKAAPAGLTGFDEALLDWLQEDLAGRNFTGKKAIEALKQVNASLDAEGQELLALLIKRSIGAGVGDTMVLKTWPSLYFLPPYMRCSLMDEKARKLFDQQEAFIVQKKLDGSFAYLVIDEAMDARVVTRAGNVYPDWFADRLAEDLDINCGTVFVGELEVSRVDVAEICTEVLLSRQEGNGILNSILKDGDKEKYSEYFFTLTAWDIMDVGEFEKGLCERKYYNRLSDLYNTIGTGISSIRPIQTEYVTSLEQAYKIYNEFTSQGFEGAVIKTLDGIWKDGTSKNNVKLKIAFEADYVITGMTEGTGKAEGMMGSLSIATSDGLLTSDVGTGFTDEMRKEYWGKKEDMVGKIVTVIANDVINKRTDNIKSLFLPVFSDLRLDKTEADSLERVMEQLQAAKGGQTN